MKRTNFVSNILLIIPIIWLIFFFMTTVSHGFDLQEISQLIKQNMIEHQGRHHRKWDDNQILSYFYERFADNYYANYTNLYPKDECIFVFSVEVHEHGFGNNFGMYFEALSMAKSIGAHFLGIDIELSKYFHQLPSILYHDHPISKVEAMKRFNSTNHASSFPWANYLPSSSWPSNIAFLDQLLSKVVDVYIADSYVSNVTLSKQNISLSILDESNMKLPKNLSKPLENKDDVVSVVTNSEYRVQYFRPNRNQYANMSFPLIPDVAICFRCNDILHMNSHIYGFIHFNVYLKYIPKQVRSIYILTEPAGYNYHGAGYDCVLISLALISFLHIHFPNAFIPLIHGHQLEALVILKESSIVICPPTTFCFWPGLANKHQVYFQPSQLITNNITYFLSDHFHWLKESTLLEFEYSPNLDKTRHQFNEILHQLID